MNRVAPDLKLLAAGLLLAVGMGAAPVQAQMFEVIYNDDAGVGFNDNQSVSPVSGNPATTLGAQRRAVLEDALSIWASRLDSQITIRINAVFDDLGCGERTTLGTGGTTWLSREGGLPKSGTAYPGSMVAALTGERFDGVSADINNTYNIRIDDGDCAESVDSFWYGLDPVELPPAGQVSFLELALHEIGHGLGFLNLTNSEREFIELGGERRPDIMSTLIFDIQRGETWDQLTAAQRRTSALSGSNLTFKGDQTNVRAAERLLPPAQIRVSEPVANLRQFDAFIQGFPPFLPLEGLSAPLRLPESPNPGAPVSTWDRNLACTPLENAQFIEGNIALVYRGECTFSEKIRNVVQAGGVGIIIVDNLSAGSEGSVSRDRSIAFSEPPAIPVYIVPRNTGTLLRGGLGGGRIYTLGYANQPPRGTRDGLVNLYSDADNEGSSVSHFSNRMVPPSVMNPSISNVAYGGDVDFVPDFFYDLGWPDAMGKLSQYTGAWFNPDRSGEGCVLVTELGEQIPQMSCYLYRDGRQFWLIGPGEFNGERFVFNDITVTSGADYGANFDPDDVIREAWGTVTLTLRDCNSGRIEFSPDETQGLAPFSTRVRKLVPTDCNRTASQQPDRGLNGSYFARNGEGIQLAALDAIDAWFITWYSYLDGQQVWFSGDGRENSSGQIVFDNVISTSGGEWGFDFDPNDVERTDFGTIVIDPIDCNRVNVDFQSTLEPFEPFSEEMRRVVLRSCD